MRIIRGSVDWIKALVTTILIMELSGLFLFAPLVAHAAVKSEVHRIPSIIAPKKAETLLVRSDLAKRSYVKPKPATVPAPFVSMAAVSASKKITTKYAKESAKPEVPMKKAATTKLSGKSKVVTATAYSSTVDQTDASPCTTANGYNVCKAGVENVVAANFLPFGSKIKIPEMFGDRVFVVQDRMHPRFSNRVDVWMKSRAAAMQFGKRQIRIEIL